MQFLHSSETSECNSVYKNVLSATTEARKDNIFPGGQVMEGIDGNGYDYLCILETDQMEEKETKKLLSKEYTRRLKMVVKTKLRY